MCIRDRSDVEKHLKERLDIDTADITFKDDSLSYDIGDRICAKEIKSGVRVSVPVTQKIVRIRNGEASLDYKTGKGA